MTLLTTGDSKLTITYTPDSQKTLRIAATDDKIANGATIHQVVVLPGANNYTAVKEAIEGNSNRQRLHRDGDGYQQMA